jgi:alcohol dehydrogenase class IV
LARQLSADCSVAIGGGSTIGLSKAMVSGRPMALSLAETKELLKRDAAPN